MARKLVGLALLLLIVIAWFGWKFSDASASRDFTRFSLKGQTYTAVISSTPAQIQQGLSGREQLGADAMLFILNETGRPPFWMIEMRFPLDFIWLYQGQVVDLHANVPIPAPGSTPSQIPTVRPARVVDSVLEVPAGFIDQMGIQVGDEVVIDQSFFPGVW